MTAISNHAQPMRHQALAELALRKIYHAEQVGIEPDLVKTLRDRAHSLIVGRDFAIRYFEQHGDLLDPIERDWMLNKRIIEFRTTMFDIGAIAGELTHKRVSAPGGLKQGGA